MSVEEQVKRHFETLVTYFSIWKKLVWLSSRVEANYLNKLLSCSLCWRLLFPICSNSYSMIIIEYQLELPEAALQGRPSVQYSKAPFSPCLVTIASCSISWPLSCIQLAILGSLKGKTQQNMWPIYWASLLLGLHYLRFSCLGSPLMFSDT